MRLIYNLNQPMLENHISNSNVGGQKEEKIALITFGQYTESLIIS